jgi:hypothetical protein
VLGVDEGGDAARALHVGDRVERERRLTRGLGTVDLDDAPAGKTTHAESDIEGDRTGGDDLDGGAVVAAQSHDRALPNCRSIWARADSRAFSRSAGEGMTCSLCSAVDGAASGFRRL